MKRSILLLLIPFALAACEQLGIDDPVKVAEKQDAEGRAIGSGCRHVGRSLEDCYVANKKASKAAIFAGWREMDGYMRENKIDTVKAEPEEAAPKAPAAEATGEASGKAATPQAEPAEKKASAKGKHTATRVGAPGVNAT
jgi:hypothetical protein